MTYGTVRCTQCSQDLTDKAQYYDYNRKMVLCEEDNYRLGNISTESKQKKE